MVVSFFVLKIGKHLQLRGRTVQQEIISRAERSWTNPLNAFQDAFHYSFKKFCIYYFSFWYEFFVHYALRVEKIINMVLMRTFGISVSSAEGMSYQPIQNSVSLFRGQQQNTKSHLP